MCARSACCPSHNPTARPLFCIGREERSPRCQGVRRAQAARALPGHLRARGYVWVVAEPSSRGRLLRMRLAAHPHPPLLPLLTAASGKVVAQFRTLLFVTKHGTFRITQDGFDPAICKTDKKVSSEEHTKVRHQQRKQTRALACVARRLTWTVPCPLCLTLRRPAPEPAAAQQARQEQEVSAGATTATPCWRSACPAFLASRAALCAACHGLLCPCATGSEALATLPLPPRGSTRSALNYKGRPITRDS